MLYNPQTKNPTAHLSVVPLGPQPPVEYELEPLVCLHVPDDDGGAVPGGVVAAAGVVVPEAEVGQGAKGPAEGEIV